MSCNYQEHQHHIHHSNTQKLHPFQRGVFDHHKENWRGPVQERRSCTSSSQRLNLHWCSSLHLHHLRAPSLASGVGLDGARHSYINVFIIRPVLLISSSPALSAHQSFASTPSHDIAIHNHHSFPWHRIPSISERLANSITRSRSCTRSPPIHVSVGGVAAG